MRLQEERKQWRKDHPYVRLPRPSLTRKANGYILGSIGILGETTENWSGVELVAVGCWNSWQGRCESPLS
jgi:hypothetical protein